MKIQIDFPEEYDKPLNIYKISNGFKTKAEAIVDLAKKQLQPEKEVFIDKADNELSRQFTCD